MNDIEAKLSFLAHYIELVARATIAMNDDHAARVFGRALFLGLDSFLRFAPTLKNAHQKTGKLSSAEAEAIKAQIAKLRHDYESYYATLRDKVGAHQQELTLDHLLEVWNEIDETTLTVFADDVRAIFSALESPGLSTPYPRPPELDDPEFFARFSASRDGQPRPRIGVDRVALTRPQTVSIIATHPTQEKCQRILAAFDSISVLASKVYAPSSSSTLAKKAVLDLVIVDLCSIVDNLFTDRAADKSGPSDPSLLSLWKADGFKGVPTLEGFTRDLVLEASVREARNKASAHLDAMLTLQSIMEMLKKLPVERMSTYLTTLSATFRSACAQDMRSRIFLVHGTALEGVVSVHDTGAIKPFSS